MRKRILLLAIALLLMVIVIPASAQTTTTVDLIPPGQSLELNTPSEATHWDQVWDLTKGDLTLSYTIDMNNVLQPGTCSTYNRTTLFAEVGVRGEGAADFNPGTAWDTYQGSCGGYMVSDDDTWNDVGDGKTEQCNPDPDSIQDLDDKHSLSASPNRGERDYDVLRSNPDVVGPTRIDPLNPNNTIGAYGSWNNEGIWWDRDGVDPWQSDKYANTEGIYDIVLTFHAIDANGNGDKTDDGLGVVFATINGETQNFYADPANWDGTPEYTDVGLSFKGDMEHMQVFAGVWGPNDQLWAIGEYGLTYFDYGSVTLSNMTATGVLGTSDPLIPTFAATQLDGNEVQFDASASHGGMGPYSYHWDWNNDGTTDEVTSSPVINHTFAGPGQYNVRLIVVPFRCMPQEAVRSVTIEPPKANLAIIKSGPVWANVGDQLTYTYGVTNAGPASAAPTLSDDKCAAPAYTVGDVNTNGLVDPGETWQFTCTYTPANTPYLTLTNTATVMPVGVEDSDLRDNTDTYTLVWTVLRKDVLLYWQGHNVGYSDPNTEFTFEMWKDGALLGTFTIKESAPVYLWLSEGQYIFKEVNIPDGYTPARAQWSWTVIAGKRYDMTFENLIRFDLAVEKTGPMECVAPDGTITYNYKVTNTGPAAVTPVLWDDNATPADTTDDYQPVYVSGDTNNDGKIQAGEVWLYTADYLVPDVPVGSTIVNTVTVKDAEDDYGDGWKLGGDTNLANNTDNYSVSVCASVCDGWYGFTPGYWKNHTKEWKRTDYEPKDLVREVFDIPTVLLKNGILDLNNDKKHKDDTLLDALNYKGGPKLAGKAQILLRAATAALLNESALGGCYPAYDSVTELVTAVNATLATEDPAQYILLSEYLDYWNNGLHVFPVVTRTSLISPRGGVSVYPPVMSTAGVFKH